MDTRGNSMDMPKMVDLLSRNGWTTRLSPKADVGLLQEISLRYSKLPEDLFRYLSRIEICAHPNDDSWIISGLDYSGRSDAAFSWNEFEKLSIEAAREENDLEWSDRISEFWDSCFPIMMSVRYGYSFIGISLREGAWGSVVAGREPEFEEVTTVTGSVGELVRITERYLSGVGVPESDLLRVFF